MDSVLCALNGSFTGKHDTISKIIDSIDICHVNAIPINVSPNSTYK